MGWMIGFYLCSLVLVLSEHGCNARKLQKVVFNTHKSTIVNKEYCVAEYFKPKCNSDEVITMLKADYGRMNVGKCIKTDEAMPCSSNELGLFDRMCSGKRSCEILIPSPEMKISKACGTDLVQYLDASYRCQKVLSREKHTCDTSYAYPLTEPVGLLSSIAILEQDCDDQVASWIIDTHPGQSINFTLIDFGWSLDRGITPGEKCAPNTPLSYGYIAKTKTLDVKSICAGKQKISHVALVTENQVQIVMKPKPMDQSQFILKYEVMGCTEPRLPANSWAERDGHNLLVGCKQEENTQTWKLMCQGNKWIGSVGHCNKIVAAEPVQQARKEKPEEEETSGSFSPNGGLILIIVGSSTLVIICIVVIVGIVCIKRQAPRKKKKQQQQQKEKEVKKRKQKKNVPPLPPKSSALLRGNRNSSAAYHSVCLDNTPFDLPMTERKSLIATDPMTQSLISEGGATLKFDPMTQSIISEGGATLKFDPMTRSIISTENGSLRYEHPVMRLSDGGSLKYERLMSSGIIKDGNPAVIPGNRNSVHHVRTMSRGQEPEYFILERPVTIVS